MNFVRTWLLFAVALFAVVAVASAQTTNGTISGHVADSQGLALPGVTVSASSPNLQGVRTVVTSENGDFVLSLLPSGTYTITFELSGFQTATKTATLAPTQTLPIDATLGPAAISETVNVVGRAADVLTQTSQVATNFKQDLISTLPTNRDINAVMLPLRTSTVFALNRLKTSNIPRTVIAPILKSRATRKSVSHTLSYRT